MRIDSNLMSELAHNDHLRTKLVELYLQFNLGQFNVSQFNIVKFNLKKHDQIRQLMTIDCRCHTLK